LAGKINQQFSHKAKILRTYVLDEKISTVGILLDKF